MKVTRLDWLSRSVLHLVTLAGGIIGLRRRLDSLRARETIFVPLSSTGVKRAPMWSSLNDSEHRWLADALMHASLPGVEDIERGRLG